MSKAKMQRCFNCGAELGVYAAYYRDLQVCGDSECVRAERDTYAERDADARERAERDDYNQYR